MNKKQLTLSDLRAVRGGLEVAGKKKTSSDNADGSKKRICDCVDNSPIK
ncbi:MAG: hypothetical protein AAF799_30430 [Myxococcota bacterium]